MAETTRAEKLRLAGIERFGSEAAWRQYMSDSAKKASHTKPQGFAVLKQRGELARLSEIGRMGGKVTKEQRNNNAKQN